LRIAEAIHESDTALALMRQLNANGLANDVGRTIDRSWTRFLRSIDSDDGPDIAVVTDHLEARLTKLIRSRIHATAREAWAHTSNALLDVVPMEVLYWRATGSVPGAVTEGVDFAPGTPKPVKTLFRPFSDDQIDAVMGKIHRGGQWQNTLKNWSKEAEGIEGIVRQGLTSGKGRDHIARQLRPLMGQNKVASVRMARTLTHEVTVAMSMESQANALGEMLEGWRYRATLDFKVRKHHAVRDGHVYKVGEPRPYLPDGWNCRCTYSATTKTFDQLGFPPELNKLLSKESRAACGYWPGPGKTDFGDWFNGLPAGAQERYLGPKLFGQMKKRGGRVTWKSAISRLGLRTPAEIVIGGGAGAAAGAAAGHDITTSTTRSARPDIDLEADRLVSTLDAVDDFHVQSPLTYVGEDVAKDVSERFATMRRSKPMRRLFRSQSRRVQVRTSELTTTHDILSRDALEGSVRRKLRAKQVRANKAMAIRREGKLIVVEGHVDSAAAALSSDTVTVRVIDMDNGPVAALWDAIGAPPGDPVALKAWRARTHRTIRRALKSGK